MRQIARVVVSNDIRTPGTPASRDGNGGWSCRQWFFPCFEGQVCKISSRSECRAAPDTSASTIFNFLKFPKPPRACFQQLVKVSSQSDEWCMLLIRQHRVLELVQFLFFFNFQNHCEHVCNNLLKFNCNRINDVCTW